MRHRASLTNNRLLKGFGPWSDSWVRSGWRLQSHCISGKARIVDPAGAIVHTGPDADCLELIGRLAPAARRAKAAVLLHGILHYPGIMHRLATALDETGWAVANLAYASTRLPIGVHAATASRAARALAEDGAGEISFIGHSLGGLVACAALARAAQDGWRPGRLVLVGSPVAGSAMARTLRRLPGFGTFLGPCGAVLSADCRWPAPVARGVAVIAGGTGGRGFNPLLQGDNDFTVTVAETRLPAAESRFLLVRAVHNVLPARKEVIGAGLRFLEER